MEPLGLERPLRIAVFASGTGSNFKAILNAIQDGTLDATVVLCVSNKSQAGALRLASEAGIPTIVLNPSAYEDEQLYTNALLDVLTRHRVNFIALAGYLRKIPSRVVSAFHGRMLNIHPALLPAFGGKGMYGRHVHEAVLAYGVRWTGVTVHLVDEAFDTGPVVLQEPVPVETGDTPESLAARVLAVEHRLYPEALRLFAENRIHLEGRRLHILPAPRLSSTDTP